MSEKGFFSHYSRLQLSRVAVGMVLFLNMQCAILFLISPSTYTSGFELTGIPGETAVRGMGILILMWNVPYVFALIHPQKYWISFLQSLIMQFTGLFAEIILRVTLPLGHSLLASSLDRFILFDAAGFVFLSTGYILLHSIRSYR